MMMMTICFNEATRLLENRHHHHQMSPIFSQSLNGANSASRRASEVPKKKENHQNLTRKIMSKSNPVRLWRLGRTGALIFTQKWPNRAKTGVPKNTKKKLWGPTWGVLVMQKIQLTQNNWKIKFIFYGLATRELYFLKKNDISWHFPRPRETDPYMRGHSELKIAWIPSRENRRWHEGGRRCDGFCQWRKPWWSSIFSLDGIFSTNILFCSIAQF